MKAGCSMTTRILSRQETAVRLEGIDGEVLHVNWAYITSIGPPPLPVS
jgi:hypothetical protein